MQLLSSIAGDNAHLLRQVLRCLHIERSGKGGYLDSKLTIGISHGSIPVVVEGLQTHTGNRLLGGIVDNDTLYVDGWIGIYNLSTLRSLDGSRGILVIKIILSKSHRTCCQSNGTE